MTIYRASWCGAERIVGPRVYVDHSAPVIGSGRRGSFALPFTTIQAAIDYLEALPTAGTLWGIVEVIGPGIYDEQLVITQDCLAIIGCGAHLCSVEPSDGIALTVTNATKASLATYRTTGLYGDLVNAGHGPRDLYIEHIGFAGWYGHHAIELLGVKGDHSATETDFGNLGPFYIGPTIVHSRWAGDSLYAKNCNLLSLQHCTGMEVLLYNTSNPFLEFVVLVGTRDPLPSLFATYDAASADGQPALGLNLVTVEQCGLRRVIVEGTEQLGNSSHPCPMDISCDSLEANDSSRVWIAGGYVLEYITVEAAASLYLRDTILDGNLTVAAGAGVVQLIDSDVRGSLTDASNKVVFETSRRALYCTETREVLGNPSLRQNTGGGGNTQMEVSAFDFRINGWCYSKTSQQDIAVAAGATTAAGEYRAITVAVSTGGVISQTVSAIASAAPVQPPDPPAGECPIAVVQIPASFTPGVTVFSTAWVSNGWRTSV